MKKTPLNRKTPLARKSAMKRGGPIPRKTPLRPKPPKPDTPEQVESRIAKIKARVKAQKPLKRSRMKPYKGDPPHIKARRADYVAENPVCQYALAFSGVINIPCRGKLCCEHIAGRGSEAREHPSSYATTCESHHLFKTEGPNNGTTVARVMIYAYKKRLAELTGDRSHFDLPVIGQAIGAMDAPRPLVNWLNWALDQNLPDRVADVARRLIEELQG